ncbi:hypothetical protein [Vibrio hippocampi]|uniref:Pectate lyase n=1 Tax=Vibrio hippocampi TaxID=654686 RepID=A0ABM8ZHR6_9VIBR|nr:hypothetical protein [Vibrio hippocampi]CAH0525352.1 hypothetical protein VHP8226_00932 [Vibrio hippocampi]
MKFHKFQRVTTVLAPVAWTLFVVGCSSTPPVVIAPDYSLTVYPFSYPVPVTDNDDAPLVALDPSSGKAIYRRYANQGQQGAVNIVPDFSYAGYRSGGVALPSYDALPVIKQLSPSDNDALQLQQAIDKVSQQMPDENGVRGVVLLKAGDYYIDRPIVVRASGVILRGEGQGVNGTTLHATSEAHRDKFIRVQGKGKKNKFQPADAPRNERIQQDYVPVGSNSIAIANVAGYSVGDTIAVARTPNQKWIDVLAMSDYGWTPKSYRIQYERTVIAIEDNRLILDIPIVDAIDASLGGGEVYRTDLSGRLQQVGIENLRLTTRTDVMASNEDRAFYAIDFAEVENSWIRDVTVEAFSHGFNFRDGSRFNTAQDVAYVEPDFAVVGGRHYSFNFDGGSLNLFQRCYGDEGRHTFVVGSRVTGPNVFLDCVAENTQNDSGPHHRWSTGILYDNTYGGELRTQNRLDSGSGHGWAGAQQMYWHTEHESYVLQAPPGAMNWAVANQGDWGRPQWSPNEPLGMIENHHEDNKPMTPIRSLYLQQLQDRLGIEAVEQVTRPEQRQGRIWQQLKQWKGDNQFR